MAEEPRLKLPEGGEDFHFPLLQPYPGQLKLMREIFQVIEEKRVGIFESPTGTGKSLSLLCGGLTWLLSNDLRHELPIDPTSSNPSTSVEPEWIRRHRASQKQKAATQKVQERKELVEKIRERERIELASLRRAEPSSKRQKIALSIDDKDDFVLDPYDDTNPGREGDTGGDSEVKALLAQLRALDEETFLNSFSKEEEPDITKIYYASRTHSQLSQMIKEFGGTPFSAKEFGCVTLGSRTNLCLNKSLVKSCHGNVELLNERCAELQKPGIKQEHRCMYYLPSQRPLLTAFRDQALSKSRDIEDLVQLGYDTGICSYYGVRKTMKPARLVAVPYNLLLNASARAASGINLENQIVIVDEAHNLMETIEAIHSPKLSLNQIRACHGQLSRYLDRYRSRLLGQNIMYLSQAISILKSLMKFLEAYSQQKDGPFLNPNHLLHELGADQINLFKLTTYLRESRLANKLHGFVMKELPRDAKTSDNGNSVDTNEESKIHIFALEGFLLALTLPDTDGKLLIESQDQLILRYILLNPAGPFDSVLSTARSVILIGGTLAPLQDFADRLCGGFKDRITTFSCGHVVPSSSLRCFTLSHGLVNPKRPLTFSFASRQDTSMLDEISGLLKNLSITIPDGLIVFFSSHHALETFYTNATKTNVLTPIQKLKRIFREPRHSREETETVLKAYQAWIDKMKTERELSNKPLPDGNRGAILLCVVGGRLSEGINFADSYGRGVIVIGVPYPNRESPELKLKLSYLDQNSVAHHHGLKPSQSYYQNLCMRAVNQSIGRVIRHVQDYAVIILVDSRYSQPRLSSLLPSWIQSSLVHCESFAQLVPQVPRFFREILAPRK